MSRCCVGAPRYIRSCRIQNDSQDEVHVHVTYWRSGEEDNNEAWFQHELSIAPGQSGQVPEKTVNEGRCVYVAAVRILEVTWANGEKQVLKEPFSGLHAIEANWLFVVDDNSISSVGGAH